MDTSVDVQTPSPVKSVETTYVDTVIMGAGPYGLSAAAYLRAKGVKFVIFGKPLGLWRFSMPDDMFLRSAWDAVLLSAPNERCDLARYLEETGQKPPALLPKTLFVDYGLWFQKRFVPDVDETFVRMIKRQGEHFEVLLEDDRVVRCRTVVMAAGVAYYKYIPPEFRHISVERASHISVHARYERFAGKRVAVIGRGQGALETAALVAEAGAEVHVISRTPLLWLPPVGLDAPKRSLIDRIRYPKTDIANGWFPWTLLNLPYLFHDLPQSLKDRLFRGRGNYGPAGAAWLKPRILGKVEIQEHSETVKAHEHDEKVTLDLNTGEQMTFDHVLLGTGYRVDIKQLPMLDPELTAQIATRNGAPILSSSYESSVPGLFFIGLSSVPSFGPVFRFMQGTKASASRVAATVRRKVAKKNFTWA